jgi:son of sevenless-like protein
MPDERVCLEGQNVVTQLSSLLTFVVNIHVARHVDIDGFISEKGQIAGNELYAQSVERARVLVRTLEVAVQSLYDDGATLFMATQSVRHLEIGHSRKERETSYEYLEILLNALKANLRVVQQTLEALLSIGHDQADMGPNDYNGSIEWRMSRMSVIDTQFNNIHPMATILDIASEEIVDMDYAFRKPGTKPQDDSPQDLTMGSELAHEVTTGEGTPSSWTVETSPTITNTPGFEADADMTDGRASPLFDEEDGGECL